MKGKLFKSTAIGLFSFAVEGDTYFPTGFSFIIYKKNIDDDDDDDDVNSDFISVYRKIAE